jgi:hypothetical protein
MVSMHAESGTLFGTTGHVAKVRNEKLMSPLTRIIQFFSLDGWDPCFSSSGLTLQRNGRGHLPRYGVLSNSLTTMGRSTSRYERNLFRYLLLGWGKSIHSRKRCIFWKTAASSS